MNELKNILKFSPIIIGLGLLNHIIYFSFFNVPIIQFMSIEEVIILFSDDLLFLFANSIFSVYITVIGVKKDFKEKSLNDLNEYFNEQDFSKRISLFLKYPILVFVIVALFFILLEFVEDSTSILLKGVFYALLLHMILLFLFYEIKRKLVYLNLSNNKFSKVDYYIRAILIMITLVIMYSVKNVYDVNFNEKYINVELNIEGEVLKSDENYHYIGKTKDYIFFYNEKEDFTRIIPSSKVSEIKFGNLISTYLGEKPQQKELSPIKEIDSINISKVENIKVHFKDSIN